MTDVTRRIISGYSVYNGAISINTGSRASGQLVTPKINEPPTTISGYLGATTNGILDTRFDDIRYYTNNI